MHVKVIPCSAKTTGTVAPQVVPSYNSTLLLRVKISIDLLGFSASKTKC